MKIHKVVCINVNDEVGNLTYGKTYDHIDYEEGITSFIGIIDDTGRESAYRKDYFISLEKWRDKQLDILFDEQKSLAKRVNEIGI